MAACMVDILVVDALSVVSLRECCDQSVEGIPEICWHVKVRDATKAYLCGVIIYYFRMVTLFIGDSASVFALLS
jgi:hypothetical protein